MRTSYIGQVEHRDTVRKGSKLLYEYLDAGWVHKPEENQPKSDIDIKIKELQKERYKIQTEKLEYNKWIREEAREEMFYSRFYDAIERVKLNIPSPIIPVQSRREGALFLSDQHYGTDFKIHGLKGEILNEYSPEIFEDRMNLLLGETISLVEEYGFTKLSVFSLGDSLEGILRHSQLQKLRWGVVDCAVKYAFYMAQWLSELSKHVYIEFHNTSGNHSELRLLDGKKGEHERENIDKAIMAIIKTALKDNTNINIIENPTGFIYTEICGYSIFGFHGEIKNLSQALKDYSDLYNVKIDYIAAGHYHNANYVNCGVRKGAIGVGSIIGIDDYSMSLRKHADATASFIVFEEGKGKRREDTIVLS